MDRRVTSATGLLIVGAIFVWVGLMASQERWREVRLGAGSADWPSVQGRVTHSQLVRRRGSGASGDVDLSLEYVYEVQGRRYTSDRVSFGLVHLGSAAERYPLDALVSVHYDPADPSVAVLEPGVTWATSLGGLAPFAAAVGLGLLLAGWGLRNALAAC